jgi:CheY-like chemotaxis protein
VCLAHDGPSALAKAARIQPDVAILDIGLPAMDGYRVAQRLRSEVGLKSTLLIAVTGYAQEGDRIAARNAGFDHHFAKPIEIARLVAIINRPDQ